MSSISQEYFDNHDEDIAPYEDNTQDSDGFSAHKRRVTTVLGKDPLKPASPMVMDNP